jgi:hypothetical protein
MTNDAPRAIFLSPAYANDSDAIDDDLYGMRCESIGCPMAQWLSEAKSACALKEVAA